MAGATQTPTDMKIETKLSKIEDKIAKLDDSIHEVDVKVAKIEGQAPHLATKGDIGELKSLISSLSEKVGSLPTTQDFSTLSDKITGLPKRWEFYTVILSATLTVVMAIIGSTWTLNSYFNNSLSDTNTRIDSLYQTSFTKESTQVEHIKELPQDITSD